jgi:DICT domain-containing protein
MELVAFQSSLAALFHVHEDASLSVLTSSAPFIVTPFIAAAGLCWK